MSQVSMILWACHLSYQEPALHRAAEDPHNAQHADGAEGTADADDLEEDECLRFFSQVTGGSGDCLFFFTILPGSSRCMKSGHRVNETRSKMIDIGPYPSAFEGGSSKPPTTLPTCSEFSLSPMLFQKAATNVQLILLSTTTVRKGNH